MKRKIIIALCAICSGFTIQAQNTPVNPIKTYQTWVSMKGIKNERTGVLFETGDSSIMVSNSLKKQDYLQGKYDVSKVDIRNIDVIKIRKKNRIWYGALIGGSAGLVIGGIVGYAITKADNSVIINDFNLSTEYVLSSVLLTSALTAGVGAIIGAAIGTHKTRIPVNGNQQEFEKYKSKLNVYAIKNNLHIGDGGSSSFSRLDDIMVDVDSNVYNTVALGGQVWMAENLKASHFRDGSEIIGATGNVSGTERLYDWSAVSDSRNLCPAGWHVPSLGEWTSLVNSLGDLSGVGSKLDQGFSLKGKISQWWSSTEQDTTQAQSLYLNKETIGVMFTSAAKSTGLTVRCLRNY